MEDAPIVGVAAPKVARGSPCPRLPGHCAGKGDPVWRLHLTHNQGWVSVVIDHDTAKFAVEAIGVGGKKMAKQRLPGARELLLVANKAESKMPGQYKTC